MGAAVYPRSNKSGGILVDMDGTFKISVPKGTVLVFSFLVYTDMELAATSYMEVTLKPDKLMLDVMRELAK